MLTGTLIAFMYILTVVLHSSMLILTGTLKDFCFYWPALYILLLYILTVNLLICFHAYISGHVTSVYVHDDNHQYL
jgi:hypothetical protein